MLKSCLAWILGLLKNDDEEDDTRSAIPKIYFRKYGVLIFSYSPTLPVGGAVASWLARSTPERELRVRALAGDIVLCSWARHFTLTVPLSPPGV